MVSQTEDINKVKVRAELNKNFDDGVDRPNHRGRGRTPAEKRQSYAEYNKRKKVVFEAEQRNFEHLVLFLASDGDNPEKKTKFYNMGGNSALIYVQEIAPRIGRKNASLHPDYDHGEYKFGGGVTSIGDLELLTKKLAEIGIKRVKTKSNDLIVYFKLPHKYTKDEIKALEKERLNEIKDMNKILYAKVVYPDIHRQVLTLKQAVYHKVVKINRTDREILQDRLLDPVFEMADQYAMMAHGDADELECAKKMVKAVDVLMDRILMMCDLQIWDVSTGARLGKTAGELNILLKGKIINKVIENETEIQK